MLECMQLANDILWHVRTKQVSICGMFSRRQQPQAHPALAERAYSYPPLGDVLGASTRKGDYVSQGTHAGSCRLHILRPAQACSSQVNPVVRSSVLTITAPAWQARSCCASIDLLRQKHT